MKFTVDTSHPKAKALLKYLETLEFVKQEGSSEVNEPRAEYLTAQDKTQKDFDSYALPGPPISVEAFRERIAEAEQGPSIPFDDWKKEWEAKKKDLLKNIG
jgi:hypothetical protein